jgi:hypothetical protein
MPVLDSPSLSVTIAQGAGIILLVGTLILLFKRTIYLDRETKQPVEMELPVFGKIKTQSPVIFIVLIGASLVLFRCAR